MSNEKKESPSGEHEDFIESLDLLTKQITTLKKFEKNQIKVNRGFRFRSGYYMLTTLGHKESDLYRLSNLY